MKRAALTALCGAALIATPAVALAQDADAALTVEIDTTVCGQATIVYTSNNTLPYVGDYRVGADTGTEDEFSLLEVAEGPFAGELFGLVYNAVPIPAGDEVSVQVELDEDQGGGQVDIAAWVNRGPEQKAYAATVTAVVDTDCAAPDDTPVLADELDCVDFPLADGRTAQDVLDGDTADQNRLDRDGDGQACEVDEEDVSGLPDERQAPAPIVVDADLPVTG